ncbi:MAG: hypothetical protein UFI45_05345 [Clostridia bacterium]|jgi:hypothetical protein|nr:hypothetical protein [Clostridia bacterium]
MKNVSEFTKTQALIDEYNKLKNKVPNLETQMKQNEKRTKVKIEKLKSDMQENQEDVEYKLDRAAVEAEYGKQIEQEEKNLEEENGKIKEEINKAKEDKKFFCTDKNFKTITMEIEAMKREVEDGKLEIKRKEYEIKGNELKEQEFSAKPDKENPLEWLELRKESEKKEQEIGKINKEINAMNKKIEEYSKFKGELNQQLSTFTAIDFNKMRERENNKTDKPEEQQENNKTDKPEEQQENNRTDKTEEQKGKNKTDRPEEKQEQQEKNKTDEPEEEYEDIYSNSKDSIKAIYIEAATGKAYIDTFKNNKKEIDIKEAIENRKGLYKRINLKEIMEKAGVESRINQFMLKRKINPVILEAINEDEKMTEEYIYSLIEKKEFPFEYKHDLENSNLSFKDMALMNRVALKESKIDGNEVIGAKKLYTIKSFFGKIKNKALAKFNKKEEPKMINEKNERQEDTKSKKERFYESIEYTPEEQTASDIELEQKNKYNEAYEKLTDEQKAKLATMDVSNIQRLLGFDYNTAVALREMTNNEDKKVTQESTTKEDKKVTQESTTKEDDESQR